jgi:hypothetical protein
LLATERLWITPVKGISIDMETRNSPTQNYPEREKDPNEQLQIIRITPEFREKLAEARREYAAQHPQAETERLGAPSALSVAAVLYLIGLLAAYFTGFGATLLSSMEPAARSVTLVTALVAAAICVCWLIYALAHSASQPDDSIHYRA